MARLGALVLALVAAGLGSCAGTDRDELQGVARALEEVKAEEAKVIEAQPVDLVQVEEVTSCVPPEVPAECAKLSAEELESVEGIEELLDVSCPERKVVESALCAVATDSDCFAQIRGFRVEITNAGGSEVDAAWESVHGGELNIETTETTTGSDSLQTTSPGHKTVGEITLRGAMTNKRAALCQWINEAVNGKPWKRMLTITELLSVNGSVKDGKQYIYQDCFPVGYVFPRMSVTNTTGSVLEEVRIKPIRCELK